MPIVRRLARISAALAGLCCSMVAAQTATRVTNTASLTFRDDGGGEHVVQSNTVALDVAPAKRPTSFTFHLLPTGYQLGAVTCQTTPVRTFTPAAIDAATLAKAPLLSTIDVHSPYIIALDDQGDNRDPNVRERIQIAVHFNGGTTMSSMLETAPDSGVFASGIPAGGTRPELAACDPTVQRSGKVTVSFAEDQFSFSSSLSLLIDPAGFVFDSKTAALIDGATVTLLDANGQPATVFGDDGVSRYPSSIVTGAAVTDASGRVYPAIKGRYRFPLAPPGDYTLKVAPPVGYVAPSTRDRGEIAALKDASGAPFVLNAASYGGTLTLAGIQPIDADIPVDASGRAAGTPPPLLLSKVASVRQASPGDVVQYRLTLTNRGLGRASGLHVTDTLPPGLLYRRGSARGVAEPAVSANGRSLDFALPALPASATDELSYVVSVAPGAPIGEALNRAQASGDEGAVSNEAAASVRIQPLLFTDALTILGRVTAGPCDLPERDRPGVPGIRLLTEDGTFVVTDRDGLYHLEGLRPGRHVVQMDAASVPASLKPLACERDTRHAGSATQRFVEGAGGLIQRADFQLIATGKAAEGATASPIRVDSDAAAAGNRDWLAGQTPGIDWLFPAVDHNPRAPVLRVVVKHRPGQRVALTINGVRSEALAFDGTDEDANSEVAISRWTSIPLADGDNKLVARVLEADGREARVLERVVHLAGAARRAEFAPAVSRLIADGLTRPLIAVRVTDKTGRPVRAGTLVPFTVDQPYTAAIEAELDQRRRLAAQESTTPRPNETARVVGDDGLAFIALQPTTQAGAVHVVVSLTEDKAVRTSDVRAWLSAAHKDWTVVGFGSGTLGYDTLSRHGQPLAPGVSRGGVADGQLALYAKGSIKGSWLLTLAYDSKRAYDPDRGLLGTIDPDRYYTVYGDGSAQAYDAPTRRKLYLRLERREAYALFGDFESGMTEAQFTRYSRTLNGVKAAYEGRRLHATGFVAESSSRYARDEIQGNGLTGPYRLSTRGIVPNSDKLHIEVRDRFRSERIVSSQDLTRHIDYDIDVDLGTVRFRSPILSRDTALNPVFIVAEYEVESGHADQLVAAGRVAARLANGAVQVGVGAIRDAAAGATVLGVDVRARPGRSTEIRAELAGGGRGGLGGGEAYLLEVERRTGPLDVLAYVRSQGAGFGVGQQNVVEAGTRKLGVDTSWRLGSQLTLVGTAWRQDQLDGPGSRTAGEVRLDWRRATGTLFVGGQFAADRGLDGGDRTSELLTLGASRSLDGGRFVLSGQTQVAAGGDHASVDFPIRHQITAAWRISPGIRLLGGYEIADGKDFVTHTAQFGFDVAPWAGAHLSSTINQQAVSENGARTFAQYGLSQSLPLGRRWTVQATLDASTTVSGRIPVGAAVTPFQPITSGGSLSGVGTGGSDGLGGGQANAPYAAVTLGATYRGALWSWNGRIEHRGGAGAERWGLTTNMLRALGHGQTLAGSVKAYRIVDATGKVASYAAGDVALALRPLASRWSVLERFQLRQERADAGVSDANVLGVPAASAASGDTQTTARAVNNVALNYRGGARGDGHGFEASVYYGAKFVRGKFGDDVYDGFVDVIGFDLRKDVSPRLDLGVQGSVQHAWSDHALAFSGGPSVGLSPAGDVWITAGYNVAGYRDRDFEANRYTRAGPYLTARLKFDRDAVAAAVGGARSLFGGGR